MARQQQKQSSLPSPVYVLRSSSATIKHRRMRHWRVHPCYWILSLVLCFYFFLQLQVWRKLHSGGGDNGDVSIWPLSSSTTKSKRLEMPTCPLIDTISLKNGLVCIEKCTPHTNNTLEGMGLDPYEMIRISPAHLHVSSMIYLKYDIISVVHCLIITCHYSTHKTMYIILCTEKT